jgi:centromere protein I
VTTHAESNGLTSQQISRLVDVLVLPGGLDRGSISRIIGSLFPSEKIDENVAVKVVGCLGLGEQRASLQTQVSGYVIFLADSDFIVEVVNYGVPIFDFS